jgi:hypothetical protein
MERIDIAVEIDLNHLARFHLSHELGADHVEGDGFGREDGGIADPAHL